MKRLQNYVDLVARVDELCRRIETDYHPHLACRKGCDACCRHLSVFPVEVAALAQALLRGAADEAEIIRRRAHAAGDDDGCPLLDAGACLLYEARPIICRTHGLPLLATCDGDRRLDWCPENFKGVRSLPNEAVINLDVLNTTLAGINALFVAELPDDSPLRRERLPLSDALLLDAL